LSDNIAGALCYLVGIITGIIFLVLAPFNQSKFVRFHAFQSIFFNLGMIVIWIVYGIITSMMPFSIAMILGGLSLLISLGSLVLWIFLMYKAYNNERFKLPIVGDLAEKQA
jgi:uncharacterized membrane protein